MGGGAVMRAASKLAGVGVVSSAAARTVSLPAEHQVFSSASRKSYSPISSAAASGDGASSVTEYTESQRPSWDLEEWEFAGVEEVERGGLLMPPRVVFGSVPTKKEAEVATLELKDALEKVLYPVSSDSAGVDGRSVLSNSGHSELFGSGGIVSRSATQPALQAFKFLSSSPEAQNVVVSVVSDENVWGAVFKNEAFVEFLGSTRRSAITSNVESDADQSVLDDDNENKGDSPESGSVAKFIDKVKISVIDLANTATGFFQNIFGCGDNAKKSADDGDPSVGSYILGLAIMVITVVVLKRV